MGSPWWQLRAFADAPQGAEHTVLTKGDIAGGEPVLVRMHALDPLSDVLGIETQEALERHGIKLPVERAGPAAPGHAAPPAWPPPRPPPQLFSPPPPRQEILGDRPSPSVHRAPELGTVGSRAPTAAEAGRQPRRAGPASGAGRCRVAVVDGGTGDDARAGGMGDGTPSVPTICTIPSHVMTRRRSGASKHDGRRPGPTIRHLRRVEHIEEQLVNYPEELRFSAEHEWVAADGDRGARPPPPHPR